MSGANIEESLDERAVEAEKEAERWKCIALYLADCHAATASYDGTLSTTSASRRKRLASICEVAEKAIEGKEHVGQIDNLSYRARSEDPSVRVMDRLRKAAEDLRNTIK